MEKLIRKYTIFENLHPNDAILDLLITGVLFNTYANQEQTHVREKSQILSFLYKLRKINSSIKKNSDKIRGKLSYKWLGNADYSEKEHVLQSIDLLILYLKGTCEYSEEVKRIQLVKRFLKSLDEISQISAIIEMSELAKSFEEKASLRFHEFTTNVEPFWNTHKSSYIMQENYFFCSKKPVEYHLNMVGAELMNRTLNPTFNKTKERVILIPTCMSSNPDCKKEIKNGELVCTSCNTNCHVNQVTKQFNNSHTRTVLIPHSSKFSKYLKPWSGQTQTGLIGVACVLNLLKGGFEMKRLGIPSQCVFFRLLRMR
jgi:hypothetical protein